MPAPTDPALVPGESGTTGTLYTALRIFGLVVLALMLVSIVYSGWISIENWGSIEV